MRRRHRGRARLPRGEHVFVDNHPAIGIDARGLDKSPVWANGVLGLAKSLREMDHHNPPYSERCPELMEIDRWVAAGTGVPPEGNRFLRNLFVEGWWLRIFWLAEEELIDIRDNWLVPEAGDPGWVDPEDPGRAGWALRDDARILRVTDFQPLPLERIGTDAREVTQAGEGLAYGLSLSPDGRRIAFHLAGPSGYQIWTSDVDGGNRVLVAAHEEYLYFGPNWSPDGEWLVYQGCLFRHDSGHDWSDLFINRPDGSGQRQLTDGQALWFGASYGSPETKGSGSNMPVWSRDGSILVSRRLPGSKVPWEHQPQRPDMDHFNRDFKPELARGGTEICRIDPGGGAVVRITRSDPPVWDFRQSESPGGGQIVFCRAKTGEPPAIWVADRDGRNPRRLTRGMDGRGADHPRWVPWADQGTRSSAR